MPSRKKAQGKARKAAKAEAARKIEAYEQACEAQLQRLRLEDDSCIHGCDKPDHITCDFMMEEAAITGLTDARFSLAGHEMKKGRIERAVKHLVIAANLGCDSSMEALKDAYKDKLVSKEDLDSALRAYQDVLNETKSPQREAAKQFLQDCEEVGCE